MAQATSSSSHTPVDQRRPMAGASQEDKITVDVASTSTTATGGTDLKEARPGTPEVPVEETPPVLSDEQQRVIDLALAGKSLFFTGSAGLFRPFFRIFSPDVTPPGTGKSLTLKELVRVLRSRNRSENEDSKSGRVFVTASTGKRMGSTGIYCLTVSRYC